MEGAKDRLVFSFCLSQCNLVSFAKEIRAVLSRLMEGLEASIVRLVGGFGSSVVVRGILW